MISNDGGKFKEQMNKNKVKRALKQTAESYNSKIFENLQRRLNLNEEDEDRIVRLLSNNNQFIKEWVEAKK